MSLFVDFEWQQPAQSTQNTATTADAVTTTTTATTDTFSSTTGSVTSVFAGSSGDGGASTVALAVGASAAALVAVLLVLVVYLWAKLRRINQAPSPEMKQPPHVFARPSMTAQREYETPVPGSGPAVYEHVSSRPAHVNGTYLASTVAATTSTANPAFAAWAKDEDTGTGTYESVDPAPPQTQAHYDLVDAVRPHRRTLRHPPSSHPAEEETIS